MYGRGSSPFPSRAKCPASFSESNRVIGPAPDSPATRAAQVLATSFPTGVTSPIPVTATRRGERGGASLFAFPHLVVEIVHRGPDGAQLLRLFVRDVDVEFLLEGHDQLDRVEAVGPEVFHEARVVGELVALDPKLFDDNVFDLLFELLHVHCHG